MVHVRRALALAAGVLLLWLALRGTSWVDVWRVVARTDRPLLAMSIAAAMAATWLRAWRWRRLLAPGGSRVGTLAFWRIVLIGQTLNIAVPARAGELARVYLGAEAAARSKVHVAATIGMEKLLDAVTFLGLAAAIPLVVAVPAWLTRARDLLGIATALALAAAFVIAIASDRVLAAVDRLPLPRGLSATWLRPAAEALQQLRSLRAIGTLSLQSVAIWAAALTPPLLLLRALHVDVPWTAAVVLLLVLQLGTAPPSTPGKVGVFEYLCILGLAPFGVERDEAVAFGLLLHAVAYVPPLVLGSALIVAWLPRLRQSGVLPARPLASDA
jgi:uncharacterized membrane protein YbhN (UPF0104 family)